MKVLVLGGSGFIGRNLIERLIEQGYGVYNFDMHDSINNPNVTFIQGNFNDIQKLSEIMSHIETVYHLISTTLPQSSIENPEYCISTNVINTIKLLDLCVKSKVRSIIFLSSGGTVYGDIKEVPISEDHELNPVCTYGISKLTIEKLLYMYNHLYGINCTVMRVSNPYGRYQNPSGKQGVIAVFLGKIMRRETITVWGDGSSVRDYIFVEDLVDTLVKALVLKNVNGVFNVGSGKGYSINELIEIIKRVTGEEIEVEYKNARAVDVPANILKIDKANKIFGWTPKIEIDQGVEEMWKWINLNKVNEKP